MNVKILKEFDLGMKLGQVKSVQLHISKDEPEYILFGYSESDNIDPWEESLHFPTGRMNLALYGEQGQRIWRREFGIGVIPGTWFSPFWPLTWTTTEWTRFILCTTQTISAPSAC